MVCFQALIKAYGRKRLQEIEDHNRKRQRERLAKRKANSNPVSAECSPVHKMVNSSAELLQRFMKLGRRQSISADNISVLGKCPENKLHKDSELNMGSLLQKVISMRKQARSQNHLEDVPKENSFLVSLPKGDKPSRSCGNLGVIQEQQQVFGLSKKVGADPVGEGGGWGVKRTRGSRGAARRVTTNHQGMKYEAICMDENDGPDPTLTHTPNVTSPDQMTITVDTEESDLENTNATPDDDPTAPLMQPEAKAHETPHSVPPHNATLGAISQAQDTGPVSSESPWDDTLTSEFGAKSVSFDNPSYSDAQLSKEAMAALVGVHSEEALDPQAEETRPTTLPVQSSARPSSQKPDLHNTDLDLSCTHDLDGDLDVSSRLTFLT